MGPINGRLARPGLLDAGVATMLRDVYVSVGVWRVVDGADVLVANFQTRLTAASAGAAGRDGPGAQGDAAQRLFVAVAPQHAPVGKGDEVWTGELRLRVVAVDQYPHDQQLLLQEVQ